MTKTQIHIRPVIGYTEYEIISRAVRRIINIRFDI